MVLSVIQQALWIIATHYVSMGVLKVLQYKTHSFYYNCISHQGHDGQNLSVGDWVAVAYDHLYYVGKILSLKDQKAVKVNFLARKKDDTFRWPKAKDTDEICSEFIFCSQVRIQNVGNSFVVSNLESIDHQYQLYKNKYMKTN